METGRGLERAEERCLRRTGIGWLSSGGGTTDTLLSSAALERRLPSVSRHEFGDLGRIFTPGDTFMFPSSGEYGAAGGGGMYKSKMAVFPLFPATSEDCGCRDL